MNALTSPKSSASNVPSKRKRVGPLLAAATAVGAQLLFSAGVIAAPPAPELDYANAYSYTADPDVFPAFYVQWETSNYSNPDTIEMQFYWGDNSTTVGSGAYFENDLCSAAETSQTFYVTEEDWNSSNSYEVGVQAYDPSTDTTSSISWIGATNQD